MFNIFCFLPCTVIASKEAGPGKLSVNVRAGGADVDSLVREGENGVYEIIFHPTRAAPHKVHIKYNEVHIPGTIHYFIKEIFRVVLKCHVNIFKNYI